MFKMGFEFILITEEVKLEAEKLGREQRDASLSVGGTSIFQTEVQSNHFIGQLGQLAVKKWLENNGITEHNYHSYNKDGSSDKGDFNINKKKIDVKTQLRNVEPKMDYKVNIPIQHLNKVDFYLFCSFNQNTKINSILGFIDNDLLNQKKIVIQKGTKLDNGQIATNDMVNLFIYDLKPMSLFKETIYGKIQNKLL